jgi:hypothetical protein
MFLGSIESLLQDVFNVFEKEIGSLRMRKDGEKRRMKDLKSPALKTAEVPPIPMQASTWTTCMPTYVVLWQQTKRH